MSDARLAIPQVAGSAVHERAGAAAVRTTAPRRRQRAPSNPQRKRVTIADVAAELEVSTATVSRALNGDPAISSATTRAVLEVSRRVGYRPSAAARRLRTRSSSLVGVVVQSVGDGYIGEVVLGIQSRARDFGCQPLLLASDGREDLESEALEVFLSEQVTEFIAVSPTFGPRLLRRAVDEGLHAAIINWDTAVAPSRFEQALSAPLGQQGGRQRSQPGRDGVATIAFDDASAGRLATTHLLELGHTRLVHLRGPNVRSSLLRLVGYRQALELAGCWPQPVIVPPSPTLAAREAVVEAHLRTARAPLGMVAYDDLSAVAALRAAHRAGWSVPDDLSIVGIDDIQFAAYTNPGLTTVAQPKQELGALAVEALIGEGAADPSRLHVLDGELVVRESTTSPRRRVGRVSR